MKKFPSSVVSGRLDDLLKNGALSWYWIVLLVIAAQWGFTVAGKHYNGKVSSGTAAVLVNGQRSKEAEIEGKYSAELNPYDGYSWFQYGVALYFQGKFSEAIKIFDRAIPVLPHEYNAIRLLGFSKYYNRQMDEAITDLNRYYLMNPHPVVTPEIVFQRLATSNLAVGNLSDSLYFITKASQTAEETTGMLNLRGSVAALLNMHASADYGFRLHQEADPGGNLDLGQMVNLAIKTGKLKQITEYLKTVSTENPTDAGVSQAVALAYAKDGNTSMAIEIMNATVANHPDHAGIRLFYGNLLFDVKQFQDAFVQYDHHLRLEPKSKYQSLIYERKAAAP